MLTLEQIQEGLEYYSKNDIEHPEWSLDKMKMIHESLSDDNFMSYIVYLSLRPELPDDDKDTCLKLIKIKRALENRKINKKYSHFRPSQEYEGVEEAKE